MYVCLHSPSHPIFCAQRPQLHNHELFALLSLQLAIMTPSVQAPQDRLCQAVIHSLLHPLGFPFLRRCCLRDGGINSFPRLSTSFRYSYQFGLTTIEEPRGKSTSQYAPSQPLLYQSFLSKSHLPEPTLSLDSYTCRMPHRSRHVDHAFPPLSYR